MRKEDKILSHIFGLCTAICLVMVFMGIMRNENGIAAIMTLLGVVCFIMTFSHIEVGNYIASFFSTNGNRVSKFTKAAYHQRRRRGFKLIKGGKDEQKRN